MAIKKMSMWRKYWLPTLFGGLIILLVSVIIFFRNCLSVTEENLLRIANYMKVQCSTYTHFNEGAETQALLRNVESCRQMRENLYSSLENGEELTEELLAQYSQQLWLSGALILDDDGNIVCSYAADAYPQERLLQELNMEMVLSCVGYEEKNYTKRITLEDGGYINMAAVARKDADGVVVCYYYITAECATEYSLTLQSLLEGYRADLNGTIMVTDDGEVVACNDSTLLGTNTEDNAIVQTLKAGADSTRLQHISKYRSYGVMLKQRDYYIYAYVPTTFVFSLLLQQMGPIVGICICAAVLLGIVMNKSELEHLQAEREKDLEYRQVLIASAQKADAANAAKTSFLQRMSHDIRTPINGICGMLEVAEHYADDPDKQAECRAKIKVSSQLLLELVNDVLDMGKLESGEILIDEQPFDLHNLLDEIMVVAEKLSEEQGLGLIQKDFQVTHWKLIGSASYIKRLLMNILSNAVKYNKPGGTISFTCRELPSQQADTATIEFVCKDTGIGIGKEYQKRIFEPFTQESNKVQSKYGGTGLGMSIVKGLVDKMGGTITLKSEKGKGPTFVIVIPFKIDTNATERSEELNSATEIADKPLLHDCHILLVEDNELNMEIAEFVLQTAGATVQKAWNGQEAVEIFAASDPGEFDAILMDMMMPVMDGCEATRTIRAMERADAKRIPIIAMTANAFTEDRIKTRESGMNAHLAKPLDAKTVTETIHAFLQRQ